jgi:hypothetical protein
MLLEVNEGLEEAIVRVLSTSRGLSVIEIEQRLAGLNIFCSKQAIYKQLKKLEEGFIVTKVKTKYSLNIAWILNVLDFSSKLYELWIKESKSEPLIQGTTRRSWQFGDLWTAHEFWIHLLLSLCLRTSDREAWEWLPYPWYVLIHRKKKQNLRQAIRYTKKSFNISLGEKCFFSELCIADSPSDIYRYSYNPALIQEWANMTYVVIEDYILSVEITPKVVNSIERLFKSVQGSADVSREKVSSVFKIRSKVVIALEQNANKAEKIKKRLIAENHN